MALRWIYSKLVANITETLDLRLDYLQWFANVAERLNHDENMCNEIPTFQKYWIYHAQTYVG